MRDITDLKPGDRVQVFDVNGSRMGQPPGGWDGEVTKVGRTLIHVRYAGGTKAFRLSTGTANDAYGHQSLLTPEQVDDKLRRSDLLSRLRDNGMTLNMRREVTTDALAAVVTILESA